MDRDNLSFGMKVIIVIFAIILVVSLMLPFFSSCSIGGSSTGSTTDESQTDTSSLSTVADVDSAYRDKIATLSAKYESDSTSLLSVANMGNAYMEWAQELASVADSSSSEDADHVAQTYAQAIPYYDAYLEQEPDSNVVRMKRAICEYFGGDEQQGLADMEALASSAKDFSPVQYYLGTMYEDQGEYDLAASAYADALTADQSNSYNLAYSALIRMSLLSQYADASSSSVDVASSSLDAGGSDSADGIVGGLALDSSASSQG
ncbi:MAG: hypothetical protein SOI26_00015 [Coriobacteriales bacterium]|jgi:tetratricopeptide (TPR) repeat protein